MTAPDLSTVERYCRLLWRPGDVREVRILGTGRSGRDIDSGYFDDPALLARAVEPYDGRANLYVTINPVAPALLARAANRIKPAARSTTSDQYIRERRWLLTDLDPVRPPDVSATDDEVEAAKARARDIVAELGWPMPIVSMSGNGVQMLNGIELPNDEASAALVKATLEALDVRYSDGVVKVDTSVHNASRIVALVGAMKVTGDSTADRPHRRSELLYVPDTLEPVTREALEALRPAARPAPSVIRIGGDGESPGWVRR